jgi:hypothetical protein
MYGVGFARVSNDPNSPYYDRTGQFVGQVVYGSNGKPIPTSGRINLGNYNPDWLLGINSDLTFKGFSLGFLFDWRQGGQVYSHTQTVGREGGMIIETLEGRADGYDLTKPGNGVIGDGVVVTGTESHTLPNGSKINRATGFSDNAVKLSAREWHTTITLGRSMVEPMIYDASFVKLRELRFGYTLPKSWTKRARIQNVNVTLVGRNLLLWDNVPHIDPEQISTDGGTVIPGVESVSIPSTRSYGVNLSLNF